MPKSWPRAPRERPIGLCAVRLTRRAVVGGLLGGAAALVAACGATSSPPNESAFVARAPVAPAAPPIASSSDSKPVEAIASSATPAVPIKVSLPASAASTGGPVVASPTTLATAPATSTVAPTSTVVPTATAIPSPTATAIPYNAARIGDVLGRSATSYAGSIPSRVHNVQLATRKINGATVAPGAVFSFDDRVGDQTEAGGFQQAYGIINNNGVPETVKADAGGICQVATTVYQAVFWAGLSIVMHYHHLYWIAHYGQPPYGMVGLDATVDFPPVDFQFRNTTSDWIRIDASYDASNVRVQIAGVDQGWKVTASQPKIQNLVKVDRTVQTRPDPTMPVGHELWIEAAEDGFDATIERTVTRAGELVDHYVYTNHYEPAHNVKVIGTLGASPTAAATPSPVASPTVAPSPAPATPTVPPTATTVPAPGGSVRVPSVLGLPEARARESIAGLGLRNTYANYQGPGQVPDSALRSVAVGAVLSQTPSPGTMVAPGTTIYLAVRKS